MIQTVLPTLSLVLALVGNIVFGSQPAAAQDIGQSLLDAFGINDPTGDPPEVQFRRAMEYAGGRGVRQDDAEAARWFRKAADQGFAGAAYILGVFYMNGRGVRQDNAEAARWFRKDVEKGEVGAQFNLGLMYEAGHGVPKDYSEAVRLYRKAAEQGYAKAEFF